MKNNTVLIDKSKPNQSPRLRGWGDHMTRRLTFDRDIVPGKGTLFILRYLCFYISFSGHRKIPFAVTDIFFLNKNSNFFTLNFCS